MRQRIGVAVERRIAIAQMRMALGYKDPIDNVKTQTELKAKMEEKITKVCFVLIWAFLALLFPWVFVPIMMGVLLAEICK
jgi:hypothetical protein